MMHTLLVITAMTIIVLMVPYLTRAVIGPSVFDRLIALNAMGTKLGVLLVLTGALYERVDMFIDMALALFLLNLITTLLFARLVRDRRQAARENP